MRHEVVFRVLTLFALLVAGQALADDAVVLNGAPSFNWTGAYIGVQAGKGVGRTRSASLDRFFTLSDRLRPKGALLGAYLGYNKQLDGSPVALGLEADIDWSDQSDSVSFRTPRGLTRRALDEKNEVEWTGAVRGRVGVTFGRLMAYGATGLAFARRKVGISYLAGAGFDAAQEKKTAFGWTVGGGVEAALTDVILIRSEYRYSDYGSNRFSEPFGSKRTRLTEERLTGGVAYKF